MTTSKMRRRRKNPAHHFVQLFTWVLRTDAYRALSPGARATLVEFYALFKGDNNGDLFMSVRELSKRLGVAQMTATRYRDELISTGFIKTNVKGSFNRKSREATSWILTEHPFQDMGPTREFKDWKPGDVEHREPSNELDTPL